jgi:hypothetical protein
MTRSLCFLRLRILALRPFERTKQESQPGRFLQLWRRLIHLLEHGLRLARCQDALCSPASEVQVLDDRPEVDTGNYRSLVMGPDGLGVMGLRRTSGLTFARRR